MRISLLSLAGVLALAGCAGTSAQTFRTQLENTTQAEDAAIKVADTEVGNVCANNKMPDKITRSQYVKFYQCATEIFEKRVLPVAAYPELFTKFRAQGVDNAQQYQDGKLSFAQIQARAKIAWIDYQEARQAKAAEVMQQLQQSDAAKNRAIQAALWGGPNSSPPLVHTSCNSYGGSTTCTSQ